MDISSSSQSSEDNISELLVSSSDCPWYLLFTLFMIKWLNGHNFLLLLEMLSPPHIQVNKIKYVMKYNKYVSILDK